MEYIACGTHAPELQQYLEALPVSAFCRLGLKAREFHAAWSYLTRTTQSKRGLLTGCLGKSGDPSVCRLWDLYCEPYLLLVASYPSMPFPPPSSFNLMESQQYCSFMQSLQWTQKRLLFLTLSLQITLKFYASERRIIWRHKCNTTLTKSDEKSHSFSYEEIRFIIRKAFSFHFLKGAFWQTLCSGRHAHKTCCHRAIWIWWQAHYHVEDNWQHCRLEMDRLANQLLKGLQLK